MTHFDRLTTRAGKTPNEWLRTGAQIAELANSLAMRDDIIAFVGKGAGGGAPACWRPQIAEMEVDVKVAFGKHAKPKDIGDLNDKDAQLEWPVAVGAIVHESMHARHTLFDLEKFFTYKDDPRVARVAEWLEEPRIEARGAQHHPTMQPFLRASALHLVIADDEVDPETGETIALADRLKGASALDLVKLAILTLGRVDAGVLVDGDVTEIQTLLDGLLGADLLAKLRPLWVKGIRNTNDHDHENVHAIAKEIVDLLIEEDKISEDPGEDGSGQGDELSPEQQQMLRDLAEAMRGAAEDAEMEGANDAHDNRQQEKWQEEAAERGSAAKEQKKNRDVSEQVFGRTSGPEGTRSSSTLRETRPPSADERRAAVAIARELEKARYQDRVIAETTSLLPPGRLRTRAAVQQVAERRMGRTVTAEPWRARHRHHVEDPNLTVGMMTDISGSMHSAMSPMATMSWLWSEAGRRVQARCASVYYGESVFPVLKPGQHLDKVHVYTAPDGTEEFTKAFRALDGALNLLNGEGARLLVISSDMYYRHTEVKSSQTIVERLVKKGVAVLIFTFDTGYDHMWQPYRNAGASLIEGQLTSADMVRKVGQVAREALEKAAVRRLAS